MSQQYTKGLPTDSDPLLMADSDLYIPTQKAVKAYVDTKSISSLTEIGAALADADEIPVYDASAAGNRKSLLSRIWTYISGKLDSPPDIGGVTPAAGYFTTVRERLTASRTYYVATTGSDSNNGLSSGAPFLTIQKAISTAVALDLGNNNITIQVADGTYTAANILYKYVSGTGTITIQGNTTTPANVVISTTSAQCFNGVEIGVWYIKGVHVTTTTSGRGVQCSGKTSYIFLANMEFGTCALEHVRTFQGGSIEFNGPWSITGAAPSHVQATLGGTVRAASQTCTITGTPAFSSSFANADYLSLVAFNNVTFSGSATGKRYNVASNGVVSTYGGGATYLPGDVAGTTATGGQFI